MTPTKPTNNSAETSTLLAGTHNDCYMPMLGIAWGRRIS